MTSYTRVFNSLSHLLHKNKQLTNSTAFYSDKIIFKNTFYKEKKDYNILCWKSKCLYNIYFNEYNYENKIFNLNLKINDDIIKIKNLSINNDYYDKTYFYYYNHYKNNFRLNDEETNNIKKFIFNYITNYSKKNNIKKIIIDIDNNLERYKLELKDEGFIPIYHDKNKYWITAEKII